MNLLRLCLGRDTARSVESLRGYSPGEREAIAAWLSVPANLARMQAAKERRRAEAVAIEAAQRPQPRAEDEDEAALARKARAAMARVTKPRRRPAYAAE